MSVVCPQGHTSQSEDYCDVCGAPIESAPAAAAAAAAAAAPAPVAAATGPTQCPHCGSPAAPNALFCENCGYDFTTGTAPQPIAANPLSLDGGAVGAGAPQAAESKGAGEKAADPGVVDPARAAPAKAGAAQGDPDEATNARPGMGPVAAAAAPVAKAAAPAKATWVAEVWIDPDWYAAQKPEDPIPSPGSPAVVPLRENSVLVGRPSVSRGISPEVDAGADTGVSRRHCQLTTDGDRWWVEDLDSANGTYVSQAGEPLPKDPLKPGDRHELADGERVFVGGWTRIVVRAALPGEV